MSDSDFPLPPPTFEFLVFPLRRKPRCGWACCHVGEEGEEEPDLPAARHAIDMLAMLAEKTRGNLSLEEQRLIENSLTELRFRFVQVTERAAKQKPPSRGRRPAQDSAAAPSARHPKRQRDGP